jgi:sugar/nucleoside kinase (ribokinase family)
MKSRTKNSQKLNVYGTGLVALDVVFSPGSKTPQLWAGGTCGNVLTILGFLGWQAFPIARLAADSAASYVKADLSKWQVKDQFLHLEPTAETPIIVQKIKRNADGKVSHRFSCNCPECGAWLPSYRPVLATAAEQAAEAISKPKIFFMDRVSRGALLLAHSCAKKGALVMFEPSGFGDKKLFEEALQVAHIVKYSNDRIDRMEGIARKSILLEIQTLGEDGIRYKSSLENCKTTGWEELKAIPVNDLMDAAGSGDWCTAGILDKLGKSGLRGLTTINRNMLNSALAYGQALAAWNCRFEGARGGMYVESKLKFHSSVKQILEGAQSVPEKERLSDGFQKVFAGLCKTCRLRTGEK